MPWFAQALCGLVAVLSTAAQVRYQPVLAPRGCLLIQLDMDTYNLVYCGVGCDIFAAICALEPDGEYGFSGCSVSEIVGFWIGGRARSFAPRYGHLISLVRFWNEM